MEEQMKKKDEGKGIIMKELMDGAIEAMRAFGEGRTIEARRRDEKDAKWETCPIPTWDFYHYEFREKPFDPNTLITEGLVCGRIFFVDEESDEEVEFRDEAGNVIEEVHVGDVPYSYTITKPGAKPKYWVYSHRFPNWLRWMPSDQEYMKFDTSVDFGKGRENTEKVLANKSYAENKGTIWNWILKLRKETGMADWFVPSNGELEVLRSFFAEYMDKFLLINPFDITWLWSSSEPAAQNAWHWSYGSQYWNLSYKGNSYSVCGVRAF